MDRSSYRNGLIYIPVSDDFVRRGSDGREDGLHRRVFRQGKFNRLKYTWAVCSALLICVALHFALFGDAAEGFDVVTDLEQTPTARDSSQHATITLASGLFGFPPIPQVSGSQQDAAAGAEPMPPSAAPEASRTPRRLPNPPPTYSAGWKSAT